MTDALVSPRFLFRFSVPCRYCDPLWTTKGAALGEEHVLPSFSELEQPGAAPEVRAGWSHLGLAFRVEVRGKRQAPWCRAERPEDSDGLQIWLDTRDVKSVHRTGRFCHRLFFLPAGAGRGLTKPVAGVLPIHRARAVHGPIRENQLKVLSRNPRGAGRGYVLDAFVAADALTGFDPGEHTRLGFTYAVLWRSGVAEGAWPPRRRSAWASPRSVSNCPCCGASGDPGGRSPPGITHVRTPSLHKPPWSPSRIAPSHLAGSPAEWGRLGAPSSVHWGVQDWPRADREV